MKMIWLYFYHFIALISGFYVLLKLFGWDAYLIFLSAIFLIGFMDDAFNKNKIFEFSYNYTPFQKAHRWASNYVIGLMLFVLCTIVNYPVLKFIEHHKNIGFFNYVQLHEIFQILLVIIGVDFMRYAYHFVIHKIPILWRMHRVHHADTIFDFTVSIKDYPIVQAPTVIFHSIPLLILGAGAHQYIIAISIMLVWNVFIHFNFKLNPKIDNILSYVLVTPRLHCVHHSPNPKETDSNFGLFFVFWDKIFSTYNDKSYAEVQKIHIGLDEFRNPRYIKIYVKKRMEKKEYL
jgi:sterol desaturase/sphingolipid hydroxylase (fatty acid hydroxylase superfamily)